MTGVAEMGALSCTQTTAQQAMYIHIKEYSDQEPAESQPQPLNPLNLNPSTLQTLNSKPYSLFLFPKPYPLNLIPSTPILVRWEEGTAEGQQGSYAKDWAYLTGCA